LNRRLTQRRLPQRQWTHDARHPFPSDQRLPTRVGDHRTCGAPRNRLVTDPSIHHASPRDARTRPGSTPEFDSFPTFCDKWVAARGPC